MYGWEKKNTVALPIEPKTTRGKRRIKNERKSRVEKPGGERIKEKVRKSKKKC